MVGMEFFNVTFATDDHNEDSDKILLIKQIEYNDEVKIVVIDFKEVDTKKEVHHISKNCTKFYCKFLGSQKRSAGCFAVQHIKKNAKEISDVTLAFEFDKSNQDAIECALERVGMEFFNVNIAMDDHNKIKSKNS